MKVVIGAWRWVTGEMAVQDLLDARVGYYSVEKRLKGTE
jgi:hypothetical protein